MGREVRITFDLPVIQLDDAVAGILITVIVAYHKYRFSSGLQLGQDLKIENVSTGPLKTLPLPDPSDLTAYAIRRHRQTITT